MPISDNYLLQKKDNKFIHVIVTWSTLIAVQDFELHRRFFSNFFTKQTECLSKCAKDFYMNSTFLKVRESNPMLLYQITNL